MLEFLELLDPGLDGIVEGPAAIMIFALFVCWTAFVLTYGILPTLVGFLISLLVGWGPRPLIRLALSDRTPPNGKS